MIGNLEEVHRASKNKKLEPETPTTRRVFQAPPTPSPQVQPQTPSRKKTAPAPDPPRQSARASLGSALSWLRSSPKQPAKQDDEGSRERKDSNEKRYSSSGYQPRPPVRKRFFWWRSTVLVERSNICRRARCWRIASVMGLE